MLPRETLRFCESDEVEDLMGKSNDKYKGGESKG